MLGDRIAAIERRIARAQSDHSGLLTVIELIQDAGRPYRDTGDGATESDSAAEIVECTSEAEKCLRRARIALERHVRELCDQLDPLLEQEAEEGRTESVERLDEYYQMVGD